ncbi:hypothetical protein [Streptacidiphilus cavernicola]|uniref:Uncharacterized protein n=1 Tax=Streptacidiphilus cavernicola TaxID=3342716 RepID=A0ABV6VN81_9ACTN
MSESFGDPVTRTAAASGAATARVEEPVIHEAYAFACFNCGFGWEQAYEIEHGTGTDGRPRSTYRANGVPVPSPLTRPSCPGCGGEHVRIMRAGRVAEAASYWHAPLHPAVPAASPATEVSHAPARPRREHRLHLPFHLHLRRNHHGTPEA